MVYWLMVKLLTIRITLSFRCLNSTLDPLPAAPVVLTHLQTCCEHCEQQRKGVWGIAGVSMTIFQKSLYISGA
jgi:hypothetical protein